MTLAASIAKVTTAAAFFVLFQTAAVDAASWGYDATLECRLPIDYRVGARYICCAAPRSQRAYDNWHEGVDWMKSMGCKTVSTARHREVRGHNCACCATLNDWQVDGEFEDMACLPGYKCSRRLSGANATVAQQQEPTQQPTLE